MRIVYKDSFVKRLEVQIDYIAQDKPIAANKFKHDLLDKIIEASKNPLMCRKSIYFNEDFICDLIFKGYTIVFRINSDQLEIFSFVKFQEKPTD